MWMLVPVALADFPTESVRWDLEADLPDPGFDLSARLEEAFAAWTSDPCLDLGAQRGLGEGEPAFLRVSFAPNAGDTLAEGVLAATITEVGSPGEVHVLMRPEVFDAPEGCVGDDFERHIAGWITGLAWGGLDPDLGAAASGGGWFAREACASAPTPEERAALRAWRGHAVVLDETAETSVLVVGAARCFRAALGSGEAPPPSLPPPSWDFGDGDTAVGWEVCHAWREAGSWPLRLQHARSDGSCAVERVAALNVREAPESDDDTAASPSTGCGCVTSGPGAEAGVFALLLVAVARRERREGRGGREGRASHFPRTRSR